MKSQKYIRTRVAILACAYELYDVSLVSDEEYDKLALLVDLTVDTDNAELDAFFRECYSPSTGFWVRSHPHLNWLCNLVAYAVLSREGLSSVKSALNTIK